MLSFPAAIMVYLCPVPCDMRRSFDGLSMMAEHLIQCNPFSGHLLVFCNRRSARRSAFSPQRESTPQDASQHRFRQNGGTAKRGELTIGYVARRYHTNGASPQPNEHVRTRWLRLWT
jgi:hypothetical protein